MQPTRVVLETERRTTSLEEGYVDVSDEELATLLRLCHDTAESLKAEMKTRQLRIPNFIPENSSQFYNALDKAARRFKVVDRVDNRASKHVDTAITILTQVQTNRSGQVYQEFLHDVLRHSSPGVVMLCAVAFGKQKLANMREDERMNILDVVRVKGGSLQSPSLDVLADDYGVPSLDSKHVNILVNSS
ncbi:hypothetical protein EJ05DRAFT_475605 [Pseudovirgaria hyperparasitica]|uniref:Uncharacterized protein n=1 Tax=Pseudovirgaria hyperparasitica TaxID=470096 RepID=A0A6A6WBQ0_9PEZI|nr:uncharacterized protein EJ05DRAFT_475605 [Pseudovirgaria hyperparasitica]KAF2759390.1 hypothetical protein EJ05DRAFT_475605 [Pseudovirgaria hyperparasitica]